MNNINYPCENVTEPVMQPETISVLEGLSAISAISVRLPERHVPSLEIETRCITNMNTQSIYISSFNIKCL